MNRPSGERVAALLTFCGAMILVLGSFAFFAVSVMVATGDGRGEPVAGGMAGMAIAGGFLLLILASVVGWAAMNVGELREWARTVSISVTAMAASVERRLRSGSGGARHF